MRGMNRLSQNPGEFRQTFLNRMAQVMFVLLPVFALLLKVLHRARLYIEHLVFSVYFHAFVFLVVTVINLPSVFGFVRVSAGAAVLQLGFPVYLYMGMRRMYGEPWLRTAWKFSLAGILYATLAIVTLMALLALTLLTL